MSYWWIVNLQGGKEEKNPPRINGPRRRRSPETESLAVAFQFSGGGSPYVVGHDSDLMMDVWARGLTSGPQCHHHGLFRGAWPS